MKKLTTNINTNLATKINIYMSEYKEEPVFDGDL